MSRTIVLLPCAKSKRSEPCKAMDMYISPLFRGGLRYAQSLKPDKIFILSAKYGLLHLYDRIIPYERTLNKMGRKERKVWAAGVLAQLIQECDLENDKFIILAGEKYREELLPHLANYIIPIKGLSMGKIIKFYKLCTISAKELK